MGIDTVQSLLNFGALGIVVILILTGVLVPGYFYRKLERENETYRDALSVERQRNSDLQQFAATGQKAIVALAEVAQENRVQRDRGDPSRRGEASASTVESGR